jgi:hypothetical protein
MERIRDRERTMLVVAGAVALGVHAGLAPDHLEEWAPPRLFIQPEGCRQPRRQPVGRRR